MNEFKSEYNFGDYFYSIVNNKIATWEIKGIYFQFYKRDQYNNLVGLTRFDKPDVEYRIEYWDKNTLNSKEDIAHCNNIGKVYFRTKEDLFKSMEE